MICHDQEPLNFELYSDPNLLTKFYHMPIRQKFENSMLPDEKDLYKKLFGNLNLRMAAMPFANVYDKTLLMHSERNSQELIKYQNHGFEGVYWWVHAVIARDWYRYAQFDPKLKIRNNFAKKDFLIYNRAWTNTREYRLKLSQQLVNLDLLKYCLTKFQPQCDGIEYKNYNFKNKNFQISNYNLEDYFDISTADSTYSADYVAEDYNNTYIEVILETLFDDSRLHLTEKSLRPIACRQPFILAGTANSLEYLKSYGFKTFDPWIDETYDKIADSSERLGKILSEMKRISLLSPGEKQHMIEQCRKIAEFNQQVFFSEVFFETVVSELQDNFSIARLNLKKFCTGKLFESYHDFCKKTKNKYAPNEHQLESIKQKISAARPTNTKI